METNELDFRSVCPPGVGICCCNFHTNSLHHRGGNDLLAPPSGAPRARPSPAHKSLLPLVAVAYDRNGDERMDGDPPQASCKMRDRRRSALSADRTAAYREQVA